MAALILSGCYLLKERPSRLDASPERDAAVAEAACPASPVECDAPPPPCPEGTYPAVEPLCGPPSTLVGPPRCWTGECVACGAECAHDDDCMLVTRDGCCDRDPFSQRFWVWGAARGATSDDPCLHEWGDSRPAPAGCPRECAHDPRSDPACVEEFFHCGPTGVRCEGGRCVASRVCLCI